MAMEWFFRNNPLSEDSKLERCINDVFQFVVKDDKYANISNFLDDIVIYSHQGYPQTKPQGCYKIWERPARGGSE